jgi:large subunit ribosomal protein L4
MKIDVLDTKGNIVEQMNLNKDVFGIKPNLEVLAQYVRVYLANQRQGTSSTLTRAEVSGGGKKPWRQKGTGRARVGSSRNPIWRHGGVSHGPKPKDWGLSLNDRVKKLAIKSALSQKFLDKKIVILDSLKFEKPKTREMISVLNNLKTLGKALLVLNERDENIVKSVANIPGLTYTLAQRLNAYEVINANGVLFLKDAVLKLEERFKNASK